MKPGRELDILIAEKVFGLVIKDTFIGTETPITSGMAFQHLNEMSRIPFFSTDIKAAWEVAQRIVDIDDDNDFVIHLSPSKHSECEIEIKYWDKSDPKEPMLAGPFYILGESAPHAICLAALKAVGHSFD